MEIIKYNKENHYEEIVKMLKSYNWEAWDERAFNNNRHYCVVENNEILFFSGFYVFDNGIYARLSIQLGKKEASKEKRREAMSLVINHIFTEAQKMGITALEFASSNQSSTNALIELGMKDNSGPTGQAKMLMKEFGNIEYLKE